MQDWLILVLLVILSLALLLGFVDWTVRSIREWRSSHRLKAILWGLISLGVIPYVALTVLILYREFNLPAQISRSIIFTDAFERSGLGNYWTRTVPGLGKLGDSAPPSIIKEDCERFVEGEILFSPETTMREGQFYLLLARLTRGHDPKIDESPSRTYQVQGLEVTCEASLELKSLEPNAFSIDDLSQKDQVLLLDKYSEWDWRVTPLKHGTLHLLLYITPILYVDGVTGPIGKAIPQTPKIITVTPDYLFVVWRILVEHWAIWSTMLTAVFIPVAIWGIRKLKSERAYEPGRLTTMEVSRLLRRRHAPKLAMNNLGIPRKVRKKTWIAGTSRED